MRISTPESRGKSEQLRRKASETETAILEEFKQVLLKNGFSEVQAKDAVEEISNSTIVWDYIFSRLKQESS